MIAMSLAEIAEIVRGTVHGDPSTVVTGPAFLDSRRPEQGGLFVAFAGERVDGHDFAERAVAGGAAAALVSRPAGVPAVSVGDVQLALQDLAREVLRRRREQRPPLTVVAVTGSQGKTGVKDLLAALLSDGGPTVATAGSFNNELGLPLTVLRTEELTRHLVLEMGARGTGHIAELCRIAPPDVGLVLNVGKAHLGEFGSVENIAVAKGELVEALAPDGAAVLNADDPLVAGMAPRTAAHVWTYGRRGSDVRIDAVELDQYARPAVTLVHGDDSRRVQLQLSGEHQAINAAAAVTAGLAAGRPFDRLLDALESVETLSPWRMEIRERSDGLVVVNDAYNANPDSMRVALETVAGIGRRTGRRTVAVLGEMRELGPTSDEEHRTLGRIAVELGFDLVVAVGEGARPITETAREASFCASVAEAIDVVRNNVGDTEVVLVKASRAAGLERLADALLSDTAGDETEEGSA
jgi:UDP-N-acetylmuramoyl-tripeptide--D-alanyl-D-alanine ligase